MSAQEDLIAALGRPSILAATAFGEVVRNLRQLLSLEEGDSLLDVVAEQQLRCARLTLAAKRARELMDCDGLDPKSFFFGECREGHRCPRCLVAADIEAALR